METGRRILLALLISPMYSLFSDILRGPGVRRKEGEVGVVQPLFVRPPDDFVRRWPIVVGGGKHVRRVEADIVVVTVVGACRKRGVEGLDVVV